MAKGFRSAALVMEPEALAALRAITSANPAKDLAQAHLLARIAKAQGSMDHSNALSATDEDCKNAVHVMAQAENAKSCENKQADSR